VVAKNYLNEKEFKVGSCVTDEDPVLFKEPQARYHALLAENRLLKEELNTLKPRFSATETQLTDDL
jgi:hypothetical protein